MRRLLLLLLLPVVWVPLIGFLLVVQLPWWGYLFGLLFWVSVYRRRATRDDVAPAPLDGAARYAEIPGGRFW